MAAKLKKGDKVVVLAGKDKGKQGTISSVDDPKAGKAVVDGVNVSRPPYPPKPANPGRPHPASDADRPEQPRDRGQERQAHPRRLPTEGDKKVRYAKTTGDVIDA